MIQVLPCSVQHCPFNSCPLLHSQEHPARDLVAHIATKIIFYRHLFLNNLDLLESLLLALQFNVTVIPILPTDGENIQIVLCF
jgi:hypothetical protein